MPQAAETWIFTSQTTYSFKPAEKDSPAHTIQFQVQWAWGNGCELCDAYFLLNPGRHTSPQYLVHSFPVFPRPQRSNLSFLFLAVITSTPTWRKLLNTPQIVVFFSNLLSLQNWLQVGDPLARNHRTLPSRSLLKTGAITEETPGWRRIYKSHPSSFHLFMWTYIQKFST